MKISNTILHSPPPDGLLPRFLKRLCLTSVFCWSISSGYAQVAYTPLYDDASFAAKTIDVSLPVGLLSGQEGVSATGAATYTIPIKVAPGTNGLEPSLSVNYSSQAGNGLLGYGWSLTGLSAITRTPQSHYFDGENDNATTIVHYNYALDGSRLLPGKRKSNGDIEEYMTEISDYSVVKQTTGPTGFNDAFRLYAKSGRMMDYGTTTDAVLTGSYDPWSFNTYYLSRAVDESGNYIIYKYADVNDQRVIQEIWYTGNINTGQQPYNVVKFRYGLRTDQNTMMAYDGVLNNKNLLEGIDVYAGTNKIRSYEFRYGLSDNGSFLKEVVEYGADGSHLNATAFKYGNFLDGSFVSSPSVNNVDYFTADVDGDGINDVVVPKYTQANSCADYNQGFNIYKGNSQGTNFQLYANLTLPDAAFLSASLTFGGGIVKSRNPDYQKVVSTDFDGDGRDDIIRLQTYVKQLATCSSSENRVKEINVCYSLGNGQFNTVSYSLPASTDGYEIKAIPYLQVGDFDGDKLPELLLTLRDVDHSYAKKIYCFNKVTSGFTEVSADPSVYNEFDKADQITTGDYDGDGDLELYLLNKNSAYVDVYDLIKTATGYSMVPKTVVVDNSGVHDHDFPLTGGDWRVWPGDFNGDGVTDLLLTDVTKGNDYFKISYGLGGNGGPGVASGSGFINKYLSVPADLNISATAAPQMNFKEDRDQGLFTTYDWMLIADYNGDGRSDILHEKRLTVNGSYVSRVGIYYATGINQWDYKEYTQSFAFPDRMGVQSTDVNGDNRTELFVGLNGTNPGSKLLTFRPGLFDKKLEKVRNGLGVITTFAYEPIGRSGHFTNDHTSYGNDVINRTIPMDVAISMTTNSGITGITPVTTTYSYKNTIFHRYGKGFLGFMGRTTENQTAHQITETNLSFQLISTSNPIARLLPYTTRTVITGQNPTEPLTSAARSSTFKATPYADVFVGDHEVSVDSNYLTGTNTLTDTRYDLYGNEMQKETDINNGLEHESMATSYTAAGNALYPNKPDDMIQQAIRAGSPAAGTETRIEYNTSGLPSRKKVYFGLPNMVTYDYSYNSLGLVTQEIKSAANMPTVTNTMAYDSYGRFPISKTNPLGKTAYFDYNYDFGVIKTSTGFDQLTTAYEYDAYGQLFKTNLPIGISASESHVWDANATIGSVYSIRRNQPGTVSMADYYDALGRNVRSGKVLKTVTVSGFNFPVYSWVDKTYDANGNVASETQPYVTGEPNYLISNYSYDSRNRLQSTCNQLGCTSYSYTYGSGRSKVTITLPSGQQKSTETDASGKLYSSSDNGGNLFYAYDSWGNQKTVCNDFPGNIPLVETRYNEYNLKNEVIERNAGTLTFTYDAYQRLVTQTNGNGKTQSYTYDVLDRVLTRSEQEGTTTYSYNNAALPGQGFELSGTSGLGSAVSFTYNALGQLAGSSKTINGTAYSSSFTYDSYGHLINSTYPNGVVITNEYNTMGTWTGVKRGTKYLYKVSTINGAGKTLQAVCGDNKVLNMGYAYGLLQTKSVAGVQDYELEYDYTTGNILTRMDHIKDRKDVFGYDNMNRLTSMVTDVINPQPVPQQPFTVTYHNLTGNITSKSDVGNYKYHGSRINAVTYVSNSQGIVPSQTQGITYTSFLKPDEIEEGPAMTTIGYDYDHERIVEHVSVNGAPTEVRTYLPGGIDIYDNLSNSGRKTVQYVPGPDGICAIIVQDIIAGVGSETTYYPYTDHLGSIVALTDAAGQTAYEQNFDPWGRYRNPSDWSFNSIPSNAGFQWLRGFTGHTHLPEHGLINMGARLYDPVLGRMLSPDNYVADLQNTQAYNRYSYAMNNPLIYVDPDGNNPVLIVAAGALLGAYSGGVSANNGNYNPLQWDYSSGRTWGMIGGGAVIGGLSTYLGMSVANAGGLFPELAGMVSGSYSYSFAMSAMTGWRTPVSLSIPFLSYDISQREVSLSWGPAGYNITRGRFSWIGKKDNTVDENLGYAVNTLMLIATHSKTLFATDPGASFLGKAWQITSRFTWELPQTAMGLFMADLYSGFSVDKFQNKGITFFKTTLMGIGGGITIGNYSVVGHNENAPREYLDYQADVIKHEYGHTIQSRILGPLYLPIIMIPSGIHALFYHGGDYFKFFTEHWANQYKSNY